MIGQKLTANSSSSHSVRLRSKSRADVADSSGSKLEALVKLAFLKRRHAQVLDELNSTPTSPLAATTSSLMLSLSTIEALSAIFTGLLPIFCDDGPVDCSFFGP